MPTTEDEPRELLKRIELLKNQNSGMRELLKQALMNQKVWNAMPLWWINEVDKILQEPQP